VGAPDLASNISLLGHTDQGGRGDGVQVMVGGGHAYVGHMFSDGVTVIDVRDPRNPKPVAYLPAAPGTWNLHLQLADGLLLVVNAVNLFAAAAFADESAYYGRSIGEVLASQPPPEYRAGMAVYDLADPSRPRLAGRWGLPGMHLDGGERPDWPPDRRYALHHAIVAGDLAYGSWRDGGLTVHDVSDPAAPRLLTHRNWSPPFGGGTHTALPLPARDLLVVADEGIADNCADQVKYTWVFDVREPANPVSIATFPTPSEVDYCAKGGHFGPHNLHENRPGSFVSDRLVFATYQNAGVRVFDLADPFAPREVGAYVPPPPERMYDTRPNRPRVIQSCDVFVDRDGVMYLTDYNAGLYLLQYEPGSS